MSEYASDALVTLGGGIDQHGVILPRVGERVSQAVLSYGLGRAPVIVMVGGHSFLAQSGEGFVSEAELMKQAALLAGVPEGSVLTAGLG